MLCVATTGGISVILSNQGLTAAKQVRIELRGPWLKKDIAQYLGAIHSGQKRLHTFLIPCNDLDELMLRNPPRGIPSTTLELDWRDQLEERTIKATIDWSTLLEVWRIEERHNENIVLHLADEIEGDPNDFPYSREWPTEAEVQKARKFRNDAYQEIDKAAGLA